jgi:nucleoside-diphosphate-sugar epimerase
MAVTILITGATGFVGFRILLAILQAGHNARCAVRSEGKAQVILSNPAIQKLTSGQDERLSCIVVPDFTVDGAFDSALDDVTSVIHSGSPVAAPNYEPISQVFEPTVKIASVLLACVSKKPNVQRVVISSSIIANIGPNPSHTRVFASTRVPVPAIVPATVNVSEAYTLGKIVELNNSEQFIQTENPHFTVSHIMSGYIFGRNELALDAAMMQTQNSSNVFLMCGMTGKDLPFPIPGRFAHVDDVAEAYLRVALAPRESWRQSLGIATQVDYDALFHYVEKAFPRAVAEGVFKKGLINTLPMTYEPSDTEVEELLARKLKGFESVVVDVAGQYLEKLGKDRA